MYNSQKTSTSATKSPSVTTAGNSGSATRGKQHHPVVSSSNNKNNTKVTTPSKSLAKLKPGKLILHRSDPVVTTVTSTATTQQQPKSMASGVGNGIATSSHPLILRTMQGTSTRRAAGSATNTAAFGLKHKAAIAIRPASSSASVILTSAKPRVPVQLKKDTNIGKSMPIRRPISAPDGVQRKPAIPSRNSVLQMTKQPIGRRPTAATSSKTSEFFVYDSMDMLTPQIPPVRSPAPTPPLLLRADSDCLICGLDERFAVSDHFSNSEISFTGSQPSFEARNTRNDLLHMIFEQSR